MVTPLVDEDDHSVAGALIAKGNPVIRAWEAAIKADIVLRILGSRGIPVSPSQRQTILGCSDPDQLDLWLQRVAVAASTDDVVS